MISDSTLASQITISIVTYNSAAVIAECLQHIPETLRVLIFDNASVDDSVAIIHAQRPSCEVTTSSKNVGFGCGHNSNLARVTTPYVLILNPDCFLNPGSMEMLIEAMQADSAVAIAGPDLEGHTLEKVTGSVPQEVNAGISGACLALRCAAFADIGYFDPELFLFYEDKDLCTKARLAGNKLVVVPRAKGSHLVGKSSGSSPRILFRRGFYMGWSEAYYKCKYRPNRSRLWTVTRIVFRHVGGAVTRIVSLKLNAIEALSRIIGSISFAFTGASHLTRARGVSGGRVGRQ